MHWRRTWAADPRARALADRHYSRQQPGTREFAPPGRKVILVTAQYRALWVSQAPAPGIARADGGDYWYCSLFRNESSRLATVLIRQAIAATRHAWRHVPLPRDGFVTFINERKVQPPPAGKPWGWTFQEVGFMEVRRTRVRDLLMLQLPREALLAIPPRPAPRLGGGVQLCLEDDRCEC
jgi:hypothetical protein